MFIILSKHQIKLRTCIQGRGGGVKATAYALRTRGRGSKIGKILRTYFMDGPLSPQLSEVFSLYGASFLSFYSCDPHIASLRHSPLIPATRVTCNILFEDLECQEHSEYHKKLC